MVFAAIRRQAQLTQQFNQLFDQIDVLVTPTVGFATQPISVDSITLSADQHDLFTAITHNCAPFNLTGHPSLSIPCGVVEHNLPVGLHFRA
ncbi:amidase family protein [Paenalcaligenes hominis]|uniref:amidase family protein n=1 Tax=Paenalcaligenes hominis TaxID=643674 RepID=UPI003523401D